MYIYISFSSSFWFELFLDKQTEHKFNTIFLISHCPVSWGYRIHRLHLCRRVRPPPSPNECSWYDNKQSDGEVPVMLVALGNVEHPFISNAPSSTLAPNCSTWWALSVGWIELNCILMINWIVWIRIVWLNWIA